MEKEILYKDHIINIVFDNSAESPRDWECNLSTMVCFHGRYNLGDKNHGYKVKDYDGWAEMLIAIGKNEGVGRNRLPIVDSLYLFDHSGITISTTQFDCKWDSGKIGFVFVPYKKAIEYLGTSRMNKNGAIKIRKIIQDEVTLYDEYLRDNVYGFTILDSNREEIDSCNGFIGSDHKKSGLLAEAEAYINSLIKI